MNEITSAFINRSPPLPVAVVDNDDILKALRATNMLAYVSISVWGGTQSDAGLLGELKLSHGATGDVGRVLKNMLAGADGLLKQTKGAYMAVRTRHYQLTLPFNGNVHASRQEGPRLLPTLLAERYMTEMGAGRRAAEAERDALCDAFPEIVSQGRRNLGTMAPPLTAYPTVEELRQSFRLHFDFEPIPTSFTGMPLSPQATAALSRILAEKRQLQAQSAILDVWDRVRDGVSHLVEHLEKPVDEGKSARFKDATIDNVRDLVTCLPGWNIDSNPRLTEITSDIGRMLDGIQAKDLRKNPALRNDVAGQARKVSDKLAGWGL